MRRSIKPKVNVIRYADDFLATGHSKELLEERVIPAAIAFLNERGLNIQAMRSKITNISTGFDFLGAHIRKYGKKGKFLMMPSRDNLLDFTKAVRDYVRNRLWFKTEYLIRQLNPRIRGWANYFRTLCSSGAFRKSDGLMFSMLWAWARRRHSNKGVRWIAKRYFHIHRNGTWVFYAPVHDKAGHPVRLRLVKTSCLTVRRHLKIKAEANVFDPDYADYFAERRRRQRSARQEDYRRRKRWEREELEHVA